MEITAYNIAVFALGMILFCGGTYASLKSGEESGIAGSFAAVAGMIIAMAGALFALVPGFFRG